MSFSTSKNRSRIMRAVGQKNTAPELRVRKVAHRMGLRFRLHRRDLPGSPDLVFPKYQLCLFVHGCYWHRHQNCKKTTTPKTNTLFWTQKFDQNTRRDKRKIDELEKMGWRTAVIWECETEDMEYVESFLTLLTTDFITPNAAQP